MEREMEWWATTSLTARERANDPRNESLIEDADRLMAEFSKDRATWRANWKKRNEAQKKRSA